MGKKTRARRRYFPRFKGARSRPKLTIPMAVVAGFVPTITGVWSRRSDGNAVADYLKAGWTGLGPDNRFNLANFRVGLLPVVAGFIVHMFAGKLGINRAIARAGIPFIRI